MRDGPNCKAYAQWRGNSFPLGIKNRCKLPADTDEKKRKQKEWRCAEGGKTARVSSEVRQQGLLAGQYAKETNQRQLLLGCFREGMTWKALELKACGTTVVDDPERDRSTILQREGGQLKGTAFLAPSPCGVRRE